MFDCRCLSTNLVSNGTMKSRRIEFGDINGVDDALSIYGLMIERKPLPNTRLFNNLLSRLVKLKQYTVAISLFRDISILGVSIDNYAMNIAINCYCNSHRVDFGFSMLAAFFKRGYMLDAATVSPLLKGLFQENRIAEAQNLFRKIVREELCEMNNIIFGVVVDGLCKAGNTAMAIQLLRVMEKGSCRPDTHKYNMIIDGLCKDKLLDSAMKLFDEMPHKGIDRDVFTYNVLINGLSTFGQWKEVKALWKEMIDCKIYPNVITFTTVIDALCKEGLVDKAHDLLNIMIQKIMFLL
ncbi:hypothetical protein BUALT_Bualt05G0056900 [Buddleja alternifolia]|uniref:Pentatricopeptide repeat-containing protein n=1 Tax=Buddleja alternifolia TaxID=168488 RepID=A0AAV6XNW7_9LAMI|nr:hypothetical protein BUALT_Bualt05G0056900 [Buddleja alternifolia]